MIHAKLNTIFKLLIVLILSISFSACNNSKSSNDSSSISKNNSLLTDKNSTTKDEPLNANAPTPEDKENLNSKPANSVDPSNVKIPVLMYHSINEKSTNNLIITPKEFEKQIKWLKDNNFTTLSLDEVYSMITTGKNIPEKPIALTFDDGYEDNYTNAYPILKKYNFKATVFLITDSIGQPSVLKENEIKEMYANSIDFQSHTASHHELNTLTYKQQLDELTKSKGAIDKILSKNTQYLCYPVGKYNDNTINAAKTVGYKMCFTTKPGQAKLSDGLYSLTRVRMSPSINMQILNKHK